MPSLFLIRHGQALDPMQGEYDGLSELGQRQAACLGRVLTGVSGPCFHGPLERQRLTAETALREGRLQAAMLMPELEEHQGHGVVLHVLSSPPPAGSPLGALVSAARVPGAGRWQMARAVAGVVRAWACGDYVAPVSEDFAAFRARVSRGLARLCEAGAAQEGSVVAFTSGGFIGAAVAQALGLDAAQAVELGLTVDNASITELRFSRREPERLGLKRFNGVAHLEAEGVTGI
jgi:broad specificity phosphatase PhoE